MFGELFHALLKSSLWGRQPYGRVVLPLTVGKLDPETVSSGSLPDKKLSILSVKLGSGAGHGSGGTAGHCSTTGALGAVAQPLSQISDTQLKISDFTFSPFLGCGHLGLVSGLCSPACRLSQAGSLGANGLLGGNINLQRLQILAQPVALMLNNTPMPKRTSNDGHPEPAGHQVR